MWKAPSCELFCCPTTIVSKWPQEKFTFPLSSCPPNQLTRRKIGWPVKDGLECWFGRNLTRGFKTPFVDISELRLQDHILYQIPNVHEIREYRDRVVALYVLEPLVVCQSFVYSSLAGSPFRYTSKKTGEPTTRWSIHLTICQSKILWMQRCQLLNV